MSTAFPKIINPWLLARNEDSLSGVLHIKDMPIVLASQLKTDGDVFVRLTVERGQDKRTRLYGNVKTEFSLLCQRCLVAMTVDYDVDFSSVLVKTENQLEKLDTDIEGIICDSEFFIIPFVEQELILAMPMIAKHKNCNVSHENIAPKERENPFGDLKNLIK